ncbi:hypothetical protein T484DRAFT_1782293 [Baffinella frigidus]|nr:hypothetical protein T484DRAFT_1782293 [Cryptophyta sp. CCMP2293]
MLVAQAAAFAPLLPSAMGRSGLLAARRATGLQMQLRARGAAPRFTPRLVVPWPVRTFRAGKTAASMAETEEAVGDKVIGEDCGCGEALTIPEMKAKIVGDIDRIGLAIRDKKASGVKDKESLQPLINDLLAAKAKFETLTGAPFDPPKAGSKPKKAAAPVQKKAGGAADEKNFAITPRAEDYSQWYADVISAAQWYADVISAAQWYADVISAAQMVDQSPVKGCMVIRPWGMAVWDELRDDLNRRIKKDLGATNAYFPIFIPLSFLSKEAEHVEGFAKECAVVTHHRLCASPDGVGLIPDPPTSETIIWDMFRKWISSHRDLPMKINQWANVVRWELRTRPFLRSTESHTLLTCNPKTHDQEGHTAHATAEDADGCAMEALAMYKKVCEEILAVPVCEDILAVPVITGCKSPSERFAGADATYTIEALMQNGWALQSGTSHFLGQNFAKAFDVKYQTVDQKSEYVRHPPPSSA